jgi:6-phosphogluconolactonase/glucosamine-6-phosphate isomerase/deaminase
MPPQEPYELVGASTKRPPRLPGRVVLRPTPDDAIDAVLADIFMQAMGCISAFGDFHFAVSVTPAIEPVLRRMLFDLSLRSFPWHKTVLWLTDELALSESDENRRGLALRDLLVTQSGIPLEQVHLIQAWSPDADAAYESTLREVLGWREKGHDRLDAVLATIDEAGSIAGLRPGSPGLSTADRLVVRELGSPDVIAMSLNLLNASRVVTVLATGKSLQPILKQIASDHRLGGSPVPAGNLSPSGGELRWYLDEESL